jgi:hypothetical protein
VLGFTTTAARLFASGVSSHPGDTAPTLFREFNAEGSRSRSRQSSRSLMRPI